MHGHGGLMVVCGLIMIAIIVVAIVFLVKRAHKASHSEQSSESLAILNERFVRRRNHGRRIHKDENSSEKQVAPAAVVG